MTPAFPVLRWVAVAWLIVWIPAYWRVWGWRNFLQMCDVTVLLACAGWWWGSPLLLSAQAVSTILVDLLWCLDAAGRIVLGRHTIGGTEYMWDPKYPRWVRLLSLFHVALPLLLVWSLTQVGYDPRGWMLQSAIALPVLVASRILAPGENVNYVERDPFGKRQVGPAAVHVGLVWLVETFPICWLTHRLLAAFLLP